MPMISAFTTCWPRNTIGRPEISSCSFAYAIIDPENEIAPISAESATDVASTVEKLPANRWNSSSEMSAAAPPPTPLKRATICGIAVIFTIRAPTSPTAPPTTMPIPISA